MLRYRGGQTADQIRERYFLTPERTEAILARLLEQDEIVEWEHVFYHKKLYDRARQSTLRSMRLETSTQPGAHYGALLARRQSHIPRPGTS